MRRFYFIVATLLLFLVAGTGCEDDYRDMVLFEGVEPLYEIGACKNRISDLDFYLADAEEIVLGIDGGDGNYKLNGGNSAVATVAFAEDINGYHRIKVVPEAPGETILIITDGNGASAQLRISVKDRLKYVMKKMGFTYIFNEEITPEKQSAVLQELASRPVLENGGYYLLIPDADAQVALNNGTLEIYPKGDEGSSLVGRYEVVPIVDTNGATFTGWQFTCQNEKRIFARDYRPSGSLNAQCILTQELTELCSPGLLPKGGKIFYQEKFSLSMK